MNIDLYLFNLLNNFAGKWAWLDCFGIFCADYLGYVLILVLAVLLLINYKKYRKIIAEAVAAAVVSRFVFTAIIRWLWFRPRPFVALNFLPLINQSATEGGFPSGHASFYFALSTVVFCHNKKWGWAFYAASLFIILGRVFVGVHWPSDILAGAILGIFTGWLINLIIKNITNENSFFRSRRSL